MKIKSICVYCGSKNGNHPLYRRQAKSLGKLLGEIDIELVYGGATSGLMGVVADAALAAGGRVTGVMAKSLPKAGEIAHLRLTQILHAATIPERILLMDERSDAFILMPGGIGSLNEFFATLEARKRSEQLLIGILNTKGFYDPLLMQMRQTVNEGFVPEKIHQRIFEAPSPSKLLNLMLS